MVVRYIFVLSDEVVLLEFFVLYRYVFVSTFDFLFSLVAAFLSPCLLDEDQQEELHEYFLESESEDISVAIKEFDGEYDEEELKIYRIKFLNDVSN